MDAVILIKKNGLYLLPKNKSTFKLFYSEGKTVKKLYENSYAKELVEMACIDSDAIQIALSYVFKEDIVEKRYSPKRAERILTLNQKIAGLIKSFDTTLGLLLETELSTIEKPSPDDRQGYEKTAALQRKKYDDFNRAFQDLKVLVNIYADIECALEEKPGRILNIEEDMINCTFAESYFIDKKKRTETNPALTKMYYFDSAANYIRFLLFVMVRDNPNICICQNCGRLFVAKTKKRTYYCDRIDDDSGKKCSEIGPKHRMELQSKLFGFADYDKAVERNYKRAKRTEEQYVKDTRLEWDEYNAWLEKVKQAKKQWLNDELGDEDFLKIVRELDETETPSES